MNQIAYYLPEKILDNDFLAELYKNWTADKIYKKTGIKKRHIAEKEETAADMAVKAAEALFAEYGIERSRVDFVVLATQSPDYQLPTTACILQDRLGISTAAGAFDINLGCSAYIYSLAVAKGLISMGAAGNVLLLMSETYAKHVHPMDKSTRTIFGDGAAAVLVTDETSSRVGEFVFGTDGSGYDKLIIPAGGQRLEKSPDTAAELEDFSGNTRNKNSLFMDGAEIFNFTINVVPKTFRQVLQKNRMTADDIDIFVFHQANKFMLDHLRKILDIPEEKFYINVAETGNTVSATIPIALKMAEKENRLKTGDTVMLMGFGVGLSWGAVIMKW